MSIKRNWQCSGGTHAFIQLFSASHLKPIHTSDAYTLISQRKPCAHIHLTETKPGLSFPQCLTWLLMGLISIPRHELATFQQLSCNCRYWFWCLRASFQFCIICQLLNHIKSPRFPHKRSLVTPQPCTDSSTRCKGRHSASRRGYLSLNRKQWCASKQPFITAMIIFTLKGRNKKKCREESRTRSSAYSLNNRKHMHRKSFKLGKATDYLPCNTKCSTAPEPFHFPVSHWRYHSVLHL